MGRKNRRARPGALSVKSHGMKCAIFENLSIVIRIESCFLGPEGGNSVMKSMEMLFHEPDEGTKDCSLPYSLWRGAFVRWHMSQLVAYLRMNLVISGQ